MNVSVKLAIFYNHIEVADLYLYLLCRHDNTKSEKNNMIFLVFNINPDTIGLRCTKIKNRPTHDDIEGVTSRPKPVSLYNGHEYSCIKRMTTCIIQSKRRINLHAADIAS